MHRCVLSYALPARHRCVSLPSALPNHTRTLPARRWMLYSTTSAEHRSDDAAQTIPLYGSQTAADRQLKALKQGNLPAWTAPAPEIGSDDCDANDFILEGYETGSLQKSQETGYKRARSPAGALDLTRRTPRSSIRYKKLPLHKSRETITRVSEKRIPKLWAGGPRWIRPVSKDEWQDSGSTGWEVNFARAQNHYDQRQAASTLRKDAPVLQRQAAQWADWAIQRLELDTEINLSHAAGPSHTSTGNVWTQIALWMLHYDKESLPDFLLATQKESPPQQRIIDCLSVLAAHYGQLPHDDDSGCIQKVRDLFIMTAERPAGWPASFGGGLVTRLLHSCDDEQAQQLYRALKTGSLKVHFNTWLQVAHYFAKHDHFQQSLDAVLEAHRSGAPVRKVPFRSACVTLLRASISQPGGLRVCLRIVDNLVKIGLTLNTQLYNVIILNAVEAGDLRTAREVYHSLLDNGLKPDVYTHAILLKSCKQDISDAETLNTTIRDAISVTNLNEEIVLATEILHCLSLHHSKHNRVEAWSTICQAYAQLFHIAPLKKLGLPIAESVSATPTARPTMMPNERAIDIMLRTYFSTILANASFSATKISEIYESFRKQVNLADPPFDRVGQFPNTYNAFIMAFVRHNQTLVRAAEVMRDMQRPTSRCNPDSHSWNAFLLGFTRHGQLGLAEQVLNYMHSKGIPHSRITWDLMISGYAGAQDTEAIIKTIRRAETSGYHWSAWTYGGLRKLRDSEKLRKVMAARGYAGELDFSDEIKQGLGARIEEGYNYHDAADGSD